ncbi:uncharacterized protein VP01_2197g1 [Puccinia sorghi]|uniref:Uncharacterized protein n=1 Tax=Puccinia sorghi TaxID=27349 RepID=A0A0L6VAV3_9BASI|nr:uncharacterized protein VP01_2197g1 [Puccinia sorghi]
MKNQAGSYIKKKKQRREGIFIIIIIHLIFSLDFLITILTIVHISCESFHLSHFPSTFCGSSPCKSAEILKQWRLDSHLDSRTSNSGQAFCNYFLLYVVGSFCLRLALKQGISSPHPCSSLGFRTSGLMLSIFFFLAFSSLSPALIVWEFQILKVKHQHCKKKLLNCLQLTCRNSKEASVVTPTILQRGGLDGSLAGACCMSTVSKFFLQCRQIFSSKNYYYFMRKKLIIQIKENRKYFVSPNHSRSIVGQFNFSDWGGLISGHAPYEVYIHMLSKFVGIYIMMCQEFFVGSVVTSFLSLNMFSYSLIVVILFIKDLEFGIDIFTCFAGTKYMSEHLFQKIHILNPSKVQNGLQDISAFDSKLTMNYLNKAIADLISDSNLHFAFVPIFLESSRAFKLIGLNWKYAIFQEEDFPGGAALTQVSMHSFEKFLQEHQVSRMYIQHITTQPDGFMPLVKTFHPDPLKFTQQEPWPTVYFVSKAQKPYQNNTHQIIFSHQSSGKRYLMGCTSSNHFMKPPNPGYLLLATQFEAKGADMRAAFLSNARVERVKIIKQIKGSG